MGKWRYNFRILNLRNRVEVSGHLHALAALTPERRKMMIRETYIALIKNHFMVFEGWN
jgi:hypothetical protein